MAIPQMQQLAALEVGEHLYIDTTLEGYANDMRRMNPAQSKRSKVLADRVFKTSLLTAVGTSAGDISYVLRVYRSV